MKILHIFIIFLISFSSIVYANDYDGKWKNNSIVEESYKKCMPLGDLERFGHPLIISNNKATMETLFGKFIGKVKRNKIFLQNNHGRINGKFSDNKLEISFTCETNACQVVYGACGPFVFEKFNK